MSSRSFAASSGRDYADPMPESSPSSPTMTPVDLSEALETCTSAGGDEQFTRDGNAMTPIASAGNADRATCGLERDFDLANNICSEISATDECFGTNGSKAESEASSLESLQRKCRRLAKERDQAMAESFEQASIAVQRGIEIENLKRSRDMLLQRLESTEMQLMMLVPKLDATGKAIIPTTPRLGVNVTSLTYGGPTDLASPQFTKSPSHQSLQVEDAVSALIEAKLALAEKEYEIMNLLGQLRAKDSRIKTLTEQLEASRDSSDQQQKFVIPAKRVPHGAKPSPLTGDSKKKSLVVHVHADAHATC